MTGDGMASLDHTMGDRLTLNTRAYIYIDAQNTHMSYSISLFCMLSGASYPRCC